MRTSLFIAIAAAVSGVAQADTVTFVELQTPEVQITKISGNGAYAVGSIFNTAGYRWTASTGAEELITELNGANGINNAGTIAGSVGVNGGSEGGGDDLGAYAPIGMLPVLLTNPLQDNSAPYDIADDGTVVGLSFQHAFAGTASAFVWTAAEGMVALPVNRPANFSRANAISADGPVIIGWNDQDSGNRTAVIWRDRVATDVLDPQGEVVGEASGVSANGKYVVGSNYVDAEGNMGSWRLNLATNDMELVPDMSFAFGVSNDGKTVLGASGFFDTPPRAALIWQQGIGTQLLTDYLTAQGVSVPAGWDPDLAGGLGAISGDGTLMGGWSFGPSNAIQSYLIHTVRDRLFSDGFDGMPMEVSKTFAPTQVIASGPASTLSIVLNNPAASPATLTADLVDSFPAGLVVAPTPAASTTCSGTLVAAAGSGSVTLQTGAVIPADSYCRITVPVTSSTPDDYVNVIPAGALATDVGTNPAAASATLTVIPPGNNGIVNSQLLNHPIVTTGDGTSLNMITGAIDDNGPIEGNWDFNFYNFNGFGLWVVPTYDPAFVVDGNGDAIVMQPGDTIGPASTFASEVGTAPEWLAGTDGYVGVRFNCDGRQTYPVATTVCYGYVHFTTTATNGFPATLIDYSYDGDGNAITIPTAP